MSFSIPDGVGWIIMNEDDLLKTAADQELTHEDERAKENGLLLAVAAIVIEGLERRKSRQRGQNYLKRAYLHQTPQYGTAWEIIYASGNEGAFIQTSGFDVKIFHFLLRWFEPRWTSQPISRNDFKPKAVAGPDRRSLSSTGALALALHYLNSTMPEHALQQIFAVIPAVCSRYLIFSLHMLNTMLVNIPEASIGWPQSVNKFEDYALTIRARHPLLAQGFFFVDGLIFL